MIWVISNIQKPFLDPELIQLYFMNRSNILFLLSIYLNRFISIVKFNTKILAYVRHRSPMYLSLIRRGYGGIFQSILKGNILLIETCWIVPYYAVVISDEDILQLYSLNCYNVLFLAAIKFTLVQ